MEGVDAVKQKLMQFISQSRGNHKKRERERVRDARGTSSHPAWCNHLRRSNFEIRKPTQF